MPLLTIGALLTLGLETLQMVSLRLPNKEESSPFTILALLLVHLWGKYNSILSEILGPDCGVVVGLPIVSAESTVFSSQLFLPLLEEHCRLQLKISHSSW